MSKGGTKISLPQGLHIAGPPFGGPAPGVFLSEGEFASNQISRVGSQWTSFIDPQTAAPLFISPTGSLQVAEILRIVGGNFETGTFLPHLWQTDSANGGTIIQINGEAVLNTNAQVDSSSSLESSRRARFVTATFNVAHMGIRLDPFNAGVNNVRRWGCYDPSGDNGGNGVFYEVINNEIFVVRRRGGIDTAPEGERVAEADFNGGNTYKKDNLIHIYEIIYNAGTILFMQDRKLIHRMFAFESVGFNTTHLRIGHENTNLSGGSVQAVLITRGSSIGRSGSTNAEPDFFRVPLAGTFIIKDSPGRLHRVIINNLGTGAAEMTLFNSNAASGPDIAVIDLARIQGSLEYQADFDQGLTALVSGSQLDITIVFD